MIYEWLNYEEIILQMVCMEENTIDMLIKVLTTEKFKHCLNLIHVVGTSVDRQGHSGVPRRAKANGASAKVEFFG